MTITNRILPVALIAALLGASVGAIVMHSRNSTGASTTPTPLSTAEATQPQAIADQSGAEVFKTTEERIAYKAGFLDGFNAAAEVAETTSTKTSSKSRVAYRNGSTANRQVYYDYEQPRKRTFWQKHRDKLTLAMGTGAGAAVGGLIGGKKGAAIGALSGAGASALYTYKLRKRN
jgi:hypothetical protein